MRVAVIGDIHGNLVGLEAALADLRNESTDLIICLGDLAAGGPPALRPMMAEAAGPDGVSVDLVHPELGWPSHKALALGLMPTLRQRPTRLAWPPLSHRRS